MKKQGRKQEEQQVRGVLDGIFGTSLKEVSFCYFRGSKAILVTYEDFKTEDEAKRLAVDALGSDWKVVVKREYSDLTIMLAMLRLYKENRIAIADVVEGELRAFPVRVYLNKVMSRY